MKYLAFRMSGFNGLNIVEEVITHDEYCLKLPFVVGGFNDPICDEVRGRTYWHHNHSSTHWHHRMVPFDGDVFDTLEEAQSECDRLNSIAVC
jgi:hypothetical protein